MIKENPCSEKLQKRITELSEHKRYYIPRDLDMEGLPEGVVNAFLDSFNLLKQWPELQQFLLYAIRKGYIVMRCADPDKQDKVLNTPEDAFRLVAYYYKIYRETWMNEKRRLQRKGRDLLKEQADKNAKEAAQAALRSQQMSFGW